MSTANEFRKVVAEILERRDAFQPFSPEMLDFNLPENEQAGKEEVIAYYSSFGGPKRANRG